MNDVIGFVNCNYQHEMTPDDRPLPDRMLEYFSKIDSALATVATLKGVEAGVNHVDMGFWDGKEYAIVYRWFDILPGTDFDRVADRIQKVVRKVGVQTGHMFKIQKHILRSEDDRDIYERRLYQKRNSRWRKFSTREVRNF